MVAETAFPWTNSANIYGIPATPDGQVQYVVALAQIVKGVPNRLGAGIFWWGTEYQRLPGYSLAGFDQKSFFNSAGNVLPVATAFGQLVAPLKLRAGLTGGDLALRWPLSGAGFWLKSSTNLSLPMQWSPVTNTVQSAGAVLGVDLPFDQTSRLFYRLESD